MENGEWTIGGCEERKENRPKNREIDGVPDAEIVNGTRPGLVGLFPLSRRSLRVPGSAGEEAD
jgi:hypothetical protein